MRAIVAEQVVAECDDVIDAGGYAYFPVESVRSDLLRDAELTADDRTCPHGVQFYDLTVLGRTYARAAWQYRHPQAALAATAGRIAFWEPVELAP